MLLSLVFDGERIGEREGSEFLDDQVRNAKGFHFHHIQVADVGFESAGGIAGDDASVVDDGDAVAERVRFEHVMRGEQDGLLFGLQIEDDLPELTRTDGIKSQRGLIEEKHLGIVEQGPRHVQALFHAARVALHFFIAAPVQTDHVQQVWNSFFGDVIVYVIKAGKVAQVVDAGEPPIQAALTAENESDPLADLVRPGNDVESFNGGRPRCRDEKRGQHLDRGRFTRSVRSQESEQLSFLYPERDVIHGNDFFGCPFDDADLGGENTAKVGDVNGIHGSSLKWDDCTPKVL